jgi:hypothetical protein
VLVGARSMTKPVNIHLDCYCHDCKLWHRPPPCTPEQFSREVWDWHAKHAGHTYEFLTPKRQLSRGADQAWRGEDTVPWYLEYRENTNYRLSYAAAAALTITLTALASSSTWIAGREGAAVDASSTRYLDVALTGEVTVHASSAPTLNTEIRLYAYQAINPDTPSYPDTLTGANANVTLTAAAAANMLAAGLVLMGSATVVATANLSYPLTRTLSLAQAFGTVPKRWGVYVAQSTGQTLHASGPHEIVATGSYLTDT